MLSSVMATQPLFSCCVLWNLSLCRFVFGILEHFAADEESLRNLVVWLEDTVVRHYKIEDRGNPAGRGTGLRATDPAEWDVAFRK
jgi:hypothetical protein